MLIDQNRMIFSLKFTCLPMAHWLAKKSPLPYTNPFGLLYFMYENDTKRINLLKVTVSTLSFLFLRCKVISSHVRYIVNK